MRIVLAQTKLTCGHVYGGWSRCERARPTVGGTILQQVGSGCIRKLTEHEAEVGAVVHGVSEPAGSVPP